jgi:hypothetical protein
MVREPERLGGGVDGMFGWEIKFILGSLSKFGQWYSISVRLSGIHQSQARLAIRVCPVGRGC